MNHTSGHIAVGTGQALCAMMRAYSLTAALLAISQSQSMATPSPCSFIRDAKRRTWFASSLTLILTSFLFLTFLNVS